MQVFVDDKPQNVKSLVSYLEKQTQAHKDNDFKAFVLFVSAEPADLEKLAAETKADHVALCVLKGGKNDKSLQTYGIKLDPTIHTTAILYKDRLVTANMVNVELPRDEKRLSEAISAITR